MKRTSLKLLGPAVVAVLGTSLLAAGCTPSAARQERPARLVITGSSTVAPLVAEIGKRYEQRSGVRVDVQTGGSSRGIADARQGLADVGMVSRALKDSESDLHGFAIARDGICLIVHRDNPIATLSDPQVVDVFTGRIRRWSNLGGREAPITVVHKAEGRSTLELFLKHFGLRNTEISASVIIGDNEQGIKTVAGNPDALGYVSIGAAEMARDHGAAIKLLPLAGVAASTARVRDGSFPLARPLTLVIRGEPTPQARAFLDFARSDAVEDLVRELSFVPLG